MKVTIQKTGKPAKFFIGLGVLVMLSAFPIAGTGNPAWMLFAMLGFLVFAFGRFLKWWGND